MKNERSLVHINKAEVCFAVGAGIIEGFLIYANVYGNYPTYLQMLIFNLFIVPIPLKALNARLRGNGRDW